MTILSAILILPLLLEIMLHPADAECCPGLQDVVYGGCNTWCCGCGACNIFCCNCANGCNAAWWYNNADGSIFGYEHFQQHKDYPGLHNYPGHHFTCNHWNKKKRSGLYSTINATLHAEKLFKRIDINQDFAITLDEATVHLQKQTQENLQLNEGFEIMDENRDGKISAGEFDESLLRLTYY